jgi:ribonuclease/clavin/mitogillin
MPPLKQLPSIAVLSPRITRILGCNPGKFTLQGTNTYLIGSGHSRILLDTGDGRPEYAKILSDYLNLVGIEISTILISHWHYDHVGGVPSILEQIKNSPKVYKMPAADEVEEDFSMLPIHDGQVFKVEGATLTCHHTPGHADDHLVFWLQEENALFSADNVLGEGTTVFSDLRTYIDSLRKMLRVGGNKSYRIYPGHGGVVYNGEAKLKEYISHRQERENQILGLLETSPKPLSVREIAVDMYDSIPEDMLIHAERGIRLHLEKLSQENRAMQNNGDWQLSGRLKL